MKEIGKGGHTKSHIEYCHLGREVEVTKEDRESTEPFF